MTEATPITTTLAGHVLRIHVDREKKLNSFTPEMFGQLSGALAELEETEDAWVGVLTFQGKHTTAGLDLPKFAGSMARGRDADESPDDRPDPFALRRRCRKPLVMAVQGICYTIGIEMALAADIVVAAEDARFAQLEPRRGLAVFGGAHVRYVQRAGWGNAMYHLLRADEFDARRALALGFVQEVVPAGDQIDRALELAEEICECAPLAVREIKRAAQVYLEEGEQAAYREIPAMREGRRTRRTSRRGSLRSWSVARRGSRGVDRGAGGGGTGRERRVAGLHRGRERLAALELAGPRRPRGQAGAHSLGHDGHRVPERGSQALCDGGGAGEGVGGGSGVHGAQVARSVRWQNGVRPRVPQDRRLPGTPPLFVQRVS